MRPTLQALIIGSNPQVSSHLQLRLANAGLECGQPSGASPDVVLETLAQTTSHPDMVFVRCEGGSGLERGIISRLRELTPATIVAVGEANDSHQILQLIRSGAADYLHTAERFDEELSAILTRVKAQFHHKTKSGTLVSVVSVSGGCGGSSVAINLSACLAKRGGNACLVDLRLCGGDLAVMLNLAPRHTISDLCNQSRQLDSEMLRKAMAEHPSGLRLLAAPPPLKDCGPINHEAVSQILQMSRGMFEHVMVDLDDIFHREQLATIRESQSLLIVLRLEFPCLVRCRRMLDYLSARGIARERIQIVANRYGQKHGLPRKQIIEAIGQPIAHYLPDDYGLATTSINVGNPVVCEAPSSALSAAYLAMSKALVPI